MAICCSLSPIRVYRLVLCKSHLEVLGEPSLSLPELAQLLISGCRPLTELLYRLSGYIRVLFHEVYGFPLLLIDALESVYVLSQSSVLLSNLLSRCLLLSLDALGKLSQAVPLSLEYAHSLPQCHYELLFSLDEERLRGGID